MSVITDWQPEGWQPPNGENIMNDDLVVSWNPVLTDIGGQPANVLGYKVFDMVDPAAPVEVADVPGVTVTLVGYVTDPAATYPVAVLAYNAVGDGPMSAIVTPGFPSASVPSQVVGVIATIVPK